MIFSPFTFNTYFNVIIIIAIMLIIDCIITVVTTMLFEDYWRLEMLPWTRMYYKTMPAVAAGIVNLATNIGLVFLFMLLPISVIYILLVMGVLIYRILYSVVRLWHMRKNL